MGKIKIPRGAIRAFWLGTAALGVKILNDTYNAVKNTVKTAKEKKDKEAELEKSKKLRPWDYYTAQQKGMYGGNLTTKPKVPLWGYGIYEGFCFILFAPTDVGKTTLALQIANELGYNETSDLMPGWKIGQGRRIMYFDEEYGLENFPIELKEFYQSKGKERIEFYNKSGGVECLLDRLYTQVKKGGKPTVAFIDNIGAACGGNKLAEERRLLEGVWRVINYLRDKEQPSIPLTVVLIGHTNAAKYADRFKHCSEGNLQGASEQANYATGMIELASTRRAGYFRLAFPKNKAVPKSDKIDIIHRVDVLNFEHSCQMNEEKALDKNAQFAPSATEKSFLVDPELLAHANKLNSKEGKEELENLKSLLTENEQFANLEEEAKAPILERAKALRNAGYSARLTSHILLLETNIYISHDTISKKV